ncbi:MAG: SPOR domain-containing protein [Calothrix sp. C42_A2020_038]|nr:SPOR domain-containing protein [Calothrix sp. C42_A2020_038]
MLSTLLQVLRYRLAPVLELGYKNIVFPSKLQLVASILPMLVSVPVRAEVKSNLLLAQLSIAQASYEQLPLPPVNQDPYAVPPVNNSGSQSFDFQAPPQQYNQGFERYLVIVDASGYNSQVLPVVKQVEPSAYVRNFGGRSVIQAGIFSRQQNAVLRIQELLASGINFSNVRLFNATNGQEIAITPTVGNGGGNVGNSNQKRSNYYYVAIPARPDDFPNIEQTVWRSLGQYVNNIGVQRRNQPRGAHIAVGPFAERGSAEQWNAVFRNAGLGNARVYYGR